ncbi:MAG TPA: MgtC/SapB family protein [Aestuariivirgaceae bacterium]|jgi:uncharacterized membrane protein (DUF4010 family)
MIEQTELITRLTVALAIGLLVGLERGWRTRDEEEGQRTAGFRTFALSGLLGGIAGAVSLQAGGQAIGLIFLGYTAAFAAFHWLEARTEGNVSVTSVVAGMLTFLLGTLAVLGDLRIAIAAAVVMTGLLAFRDYLHRWVASLTWEEIRAVLILLAMTFLLLPILPDRTVDRWNIINPHDIWLLAILIAAISFAGYVAMRVFGERSGIIMTAVAGGLASSTATTLAFAKLARDHPTSSRLLSAGILLSSLVMMLRVGTLAIVLNNALLLLLAPPLAVAAIALAGGAATLLFGSSEDKMPELRIHNPLALGSALRLAAFIALVMLAAELLRQTFGKLGVLIVAAISGIADVDAITISMARLGGDAIDLNTAFGAIIVAVAVNTVSKVVLAGWVAGKRVGILAGGCSVIALLGLLITSAQLLPI